MGILRAFVCACFLLIFSVPFVEAEEQKAPAVKVGPVDSVTIQSAQGGTQKLQNEPFFITGPAFENGQAMPEKYTCKGADTNPPLVIHNVPQGAKSLALTVFDPEGTVGPWVHWVVFGIPPDTREIGEKFSGAVQALNDFGNFYYNGPCIPDQKRHKYVFTVYALSDMLAGQTEGATMDTLLKAMAGKVLAKAELIGSYQNSDTE